MLTRNFIVKINLSKYHSLKRFKHKATHWSIQKKNKTSCDRALDHFDEFYSQTFAEDWPSIRHGLLSKQKYIAVVNNFSDADQTNLNLEKIGALNVRTLFQLEKQYISDNYAKLRQKYNLTKIWKKDEKIARELVKNDSVENVYQSYSLEHNSSNAEIDFTRVIPQQDVSFLNLTEFMPVTKLKGLEDWIAEPQHLENYNLNVYCYEIGNHNDFSSPKNGTTGVLNYYLMDGGSLLPVLALDVKPGDKVLDMCASPGGKSYLILQTLYPDQVICNDVTKSRAKRIYNVMKQYLYDLEEKWLNQNKLQISLMDGRDIRDGFDKIIVDVPCTTDRHSVKELENNIFRPDRIKERLKLPELQAELLVQAIKLVKIGGNIVYSTCTLSPIQNDGVVHLALKQIWEETDIEIAIKDLSVALLQATKMYKFADQKLMKYGHLIVPNLQINFGPTYFCKLQRIK
ncbi:16S rRNA methyltransferase RsmB/F [Popillia japonica]|uniref:NOL1/NOP2/Sun domain family member 4 n=1 Tax=Popillia japonica TaxID=7064 RepID=A0AAW1N452_POPJA